MPDSDQIRADLQAAGRLMIEHDLTWGSAGNISARSGPDTFLITTSGARLGKLTPDDFVNCLVASGPPAESVPNPSKELPMHRAIYATRSDVNVVLHAEPLYATLVACTDLDVPANWFVSAMYNLERVTRVPYHHPGTTALGDAVREQAQSANVLLLENHGVLVYDTSMSQAIMGLETLEIACQMLILARTAGLNVRALPPDTVTDFLNNAGYKPRRQWLLP